jgi:hypothetical protein
VCASKPGRAERKNETTGTVSHCIYKNGSFQAENSFGLGGFVRQSKIIIIRRNIIDKVKIPDESCDRLCPKTVRPNAGLTSGGTTLPTVRINQLDGQKTCCSRS